jgi:alpha/beta hydrolase fold
VSRRSVAPAEHAAAALAARLERCHRRAVKRLAGNKDRYGFAAPAYAAKGFLVVLPDYRLIPQVRFAAFVQDSAAAIAWTWRNPARFGASSSREGALHVRA